MQGTREHILEFIVRNREARVEDLAAELSITAAAVRRHLDHLRADGMVDVHAVRQATGRPYHVYIPTERAAGALPVSYAGLIERVLKSLDDDDPFSAAVSGRMAESVAEKHRAEVSSTDPDALVAQVTASLRTEGILESWSVDEDGYHLINGACPYRVAAEISNLPCESDRKAIELLLGAHVEQVHRIIDGSPICEYVIRGAEDFIPLRETTRNALPLGQGV